MTDPNLPRSDTGAILNRSGVTEARLPLRVECIPFPGVAKGLPQGSVVDEWWVFDADDLAVAGPLIEADADRIVHAEASAFSTKRAEDEPTPESQWAPGTTAFGSTWSSTQQTPEERR
jgi:hypothetical protein